MHKGVVLTNQNVSVTVGIAGGDRLRAAEIYEEAFAAKLGIAIKHQEHRISLLRDGLNLGYAIAARHGEYLVGIAGFTTESNAFTGGITYRKILKEVGFFKGQKAAFILSLFERKARENELLMDGIAVCAEHRGEGHGTRLFDALKVYAKDHNYKSIRLDVVDTNADARRLYERLGFVVERTNTFEALRPWLGFGASSTMVYQLG